MQIASHELLASGGALLAQAHRLPHNFVLLQATPSWWLFGIDFDHLCSALYYTLYHTKPFLGTTCYSTPLCGDVCVPVPNTAGLDMKLLMPACGRVTSHGPFAMLLWASCL